MGNAKTHEVSALFPEIRAANNSPAEMIREAIKGSADLEKLEKLLELQERWEGAQAKKAYHVAMTAFKSNPPSIEKDKKVSFGTTKYSHASLSNVTAKINGELSKHGLSASWIVSQNGVISVTCKITHEQGHSEETTLSAPADTSGSKNPIQSIGSTIAYLERYTILALTGLATHDMDADGIVEVEKITAEEAKAMTDGISALGGSLEKFLIYMGIKSMADMPKSEMQRAKIAIEATKQKQAEKK